MIRRLYNEALYLGALEWIVLAGVVSWALVGFCVITEAAPPISIASEDAPAVVAVQTETQGARHEGRSGPAESRRQDVAMRADLRPLIYVYSSANCPACGRFADWLRDHAADSPFRFELRKAPDWVTGFPAFHWERTKGQWSVLYGWSGIDDLQRRWQAITPRWEPAATVETAKTVPPGDGGLPVVSASNVQELLPLVQRFAGQSGKFVFTPDAPVDAVVKDGLTVRYATISGRYDMRGKNPRLSLDQPVPSGTVTVPWTFGAWRVGYRVEGAVLEPDAVVVETDLKRVRIEFEDGGT
jgi:hypothetical protein